MSRQDGICPFCNHALNPSSSTCPTCGRNIFQGNSDSSGTATRLPNQSAMPKSDPMSQIDGWSRNQQIGNQWCLPLALVVVALCLLLVVGSVWGIAQVAMRLSHPEEKVVVPTSTTVITQIQTMGKLETVSYTLEKVIVYDQNAGSWSWFWNVFGDHKKLFLVHGEVIAGVDLSELREENITIQGGPDIKTTSITLSMPASRILHAYVDESRTKIYDANTGTYGILNNQMDPNKVTEVLDNSKKTLASEACQGGILQKASESAKVQLTSFLTAIGFRHVTINVRSGTCS